MTQLGRWLAMPPDTDGLEGALRSDARGFGVRHPRIVHYPASREQCDLLEIPYPSDIWGWKGELELTALPAHTVGSAR